MHPLLSPAITVKALVASGTNTNVFPVLPPGIHVYDIPPVKAISSCEPVHTYPGEDELVTTGPAIACSVWLTELTVPLVAVSVTV